MNRHLDCYRDNVICIIGMGYVGVTLAVALADAGLTIVGVEINESILEQLTLLRPSFFEENLEEHLHRHLVSGRITVSRTIPRKETISVYIVTVGTPVNQDKKINLEPIITVSKQIAEVIKPDDLVILRSTVKVGVTRNVVLPILTERHARVHVAYCPERTIEGKALAELNSLPQIVSGLNDESLMRASALFQQLTRTIVPAESLEAAERWKFQLRMGMLAKNLRSRLVIR